MKKTRRFPAGDSSFIVRLGVPTARKFLDDARSLPAVNGKGFAELSVAWNTSQSRRCRAAQERSEIPFRKPCKEIPRQNTELLLCSKRCQFATDHVGRGPEKACRPLSKKSGEALCSPHLGHLTQIRPSARRSQVIVNGVRETSYQFKQRGSG